LFFFFASAVNAYIHVHFVAVYSSNGRDGGLKWPAFSTLLSLIWVCGIVT